MNGCVYILEGNEQVYIGVTARRLSERYKEHKYASKVCRAYRSAPCFWGEEAPTIRSIENLPNTDRKRMRSREKFYINKISCNNR
jgi:predicted GIY-YIG superfamily endonuclease